MTTQEQRFHAAVAAMQGILAAYTNEGRDDIAKSAVLQADALLAELDRTAVVKDSLTTQPDASGWIPHRPGDAMPKNVGMAKDTKGAIYKNPWDVRNPEYWSADYEIPFIAWKPANP